MTVVKQPGTGYITFLCNGSNGCRAELETDFKDFDLAIALMRSEGWAFKKEGTVHSPIYRHYCEDCKEDYHVYG